MKNAIEEKEKVDVGASRMTYNSLLVIAAGFIKGEGQ